MNDGTTINALLGVITVIATGLVGYLTTRGKTTGAIELKRADTNTEITREYITAQATEITRLNGVIEHKEKNIEQLNLLLREVTQKLHETAVSLATKEVQYTGSLTELKRALEEIDEMKKRVNTALDLPDKHQ